jgi:hypothetical protein
VRKLKDVLAVVRGGITNALAAVAWAVWERTVHRLLVRSEAWEYQSKRGR